MLCECEPLIDEVLMLRGTLQVTATTGELGNAWAGISDTGRLGSVDFDLQQGKVRQRPQGQATTGRQRPAFGMMPIPCGKQN